ncbi:MAG: hypothetical protein M3Q03_12560 [Chloroflexota bacterium]|nr:hypothetical protein [Chloroflexota bacterium]
MLGSACRGELLPSVIAGTRNGAKVRELTTLLDGVACLAPLPLDISLEYQEDGDETGETIEAIAAEKASAWSLRLRKPGSEPVVVASDGGLLVPALANRWDPTRTRRFAGAGAGAPARADALIALADHLEGDQRRVGWREAVAFAKGGEVLACFAAESVPGLLARNYSSWLLDADGFWVPALWICPEFDGRRLAELTPEEQATREDHWRRLRREVLQAFRGELGG